MSGKSKASLFCKYGRNCNLNSIYYSKMENEHCIMCCGCSYSKSLLSVVKNIFNWLWHNFNRSRTPFLNNQGANLKKTLRRLITLSYRSSAHNYLPKNRVDNNLLLTSVCHIGFMIGLIFFDDPAKQPKTMLHTTKIVQICQKINLVLNYQNLRQESQSQINSRTELAIKNVLRAAH